jgi:bis(5'-nucleosyl)-tetraphosphatase (symmetrical)
MNYLLGDLQGCCDALHRLLAEIDFSPSRDRLYVLGDLVNRGPASVETLETLAGLGASATCLLGNHDLHLLAVAAGVRPPHRSDTLGPLLASARREHWLHWLRHQRLALFEHGWLMVHAGLPPQWDAAQTLVEAGRIEAQLQGPDLPALLQHMYGNEPVRWSDTLQGHDRSRCAINALTRLRFCTPEGDMDFKAKDGADQAPPGTLPWFDIPTRRSADVRIAFGHWSTLGLLNRPTLLGLDTGCVWGGALTSARIDGDARDIIQVPCKAAQQPGRD